jgi:hypothetical protein
VLQHRLAGLGAPDQAVEQVEPVGVARLDRLGGEADQGAGHAEAALTLGKRGLGERLCGAADRPVEGLRGRPGEHVRPGGGAPAVPVGLARKHDAGHGTGTLCQHSTHIEPGIQPSGRMARLDRGAPRMTTPIPVARAREIVPGKV